MLSRSQMSFHGSVAERMAYTSLGLANYNEITTTVAARKQRRKSFLLAILPLMSMAVGAVKPEASSAVADGMFRTSVGRLG
jgi:hypothetical protein